jgi:signal transduction histidine kinase
VRLTESLLMMVRIDSGEIAIEISRRSDRVNLSSMVTSARYKLEDTIALKTGLSLETNIVESITVLGVEYLLQDAVTRVLDNALSFVKKEGGHIVINARAENGYAILDIIDNGTGIAPENQERIFERFVQINRAEMEQQGIGLGLAIARSLIQQHGGDIRVVSALEMGSTFSLTIPLADEITA